MPCFKGIAVSVYAEGTPLPEYSVQKQSRASRVSTYIPVPKPRLRKNTDRLEPSKFAISITLLTPGLPVPYSQPKPTSQNPHPTPQIVAGRPGLSAPRGSFTATVCPYIPLTKSKNETIAAYIYFDGRAKEEVATLLRPGEETWVNSRWVLLPESEGGGLAEREFLFREVGLERWLNGLDLNGRDAASKIEKRRLKYEKRCKRIKAEAGGDEDIIPAAPPRKIETRGILRYSDDEKSPVEQIPNENYRWSSDSDDEATLETAGQIKVAMFRVFASGEIKRGEYSPQFNAHDDEEENIKAGNPDEADIDHTTSFAKPKNLDPKTVSTQTVTGIDGPDQPFAVFTFFYRGERQLQKMGIMPPKQSKPSNNSRRYYSNQLDFSNLGPLKLGGTVGFSSFRENKPAAKRAKIRKKSNGRFPGAMNEDSDEDTEETESLAKLQDNDEGEVRPVLSSEDTMNTGDIADGVGRIKLKRQHSAEPVKANLRKSPVSSGTISVGASPGLTSPAGSDINLSSFQTPPICAFGANVSVETSVGSPMKRHRASLHNTDTDAILRDSFTSLGGDIVAVAEAAEASLPTSDAKIEEEQL